MAQGDLNSEGCPQTGHHSVTCHHILSTYMRTTPAVHTAGEPIRHNPLGHSLTWMRGRHRLHSSWGRLEPTPSRPHCYPRKGGTGHVAQVYYPRGNASQICAGGRSRHMRKILQHASALQTSGLHVSVYTVLATPAQFTVHDARTFACDA